MALTPKQSIFAHEFLIDFNLTQAAIRAGYRAKSASGAGYRNLRNPEVMQLIKDAADERATKHGLNPDQILADLIDLKDSAINAGSFGPAVRALELAGKHLRMFVDRVELAGENGFADRLMEARKRLTTNDTNRSNTSG